MVGPVRGHTQANTALSAFAGSPARRVPRGPASPRRAARLDGEHAGLPEPRGRPGHPTQRRPAGAGRGPAQRSAVVAWLVIVMKQQRRACLLWLPWPTLTVLCAKRFDECQGNPKKKVVVLGLVASQATRSE